MELHDYIEVGIEMTGTGRKLAEYLGIGANELSDAKNHRRGLPNHCCVKLAQLIETDPLKVIAASELATEKKEERRQFWAPFVELGNLARHLAIMGTLALVTNFVTPPPAEAAPMLKATIVTINLM